MCVVIDDLSADSVGSLSQPKSDVSDFGHSFDCPNSGKPEFGWERGGVRSLGLSRKPNPLTPTLSPAGRGSRPSMRRGHRLTPVALGAAMLLAAAADPAPAQDFYRGKTIDIIVATSPAGGYDQYARLLARHMGKHIPGNPNFAVQHMPGAGGIRAANYL